MSNVPFASTHTVTRQTGDYEDGEWVADDPTTVNITAHIQAFTESDNDQKAANRLGLDSVEGCIWIDSNDELFTARKSASGCPDVLTWNGQDYEIRQSAHFPDVLPHWECIGVLIDDNT